MTAWVWWTVRTLHILWAYYPSTLLVRSRLISTQDPLLTVVPSTHDPPGILRTDGAVQTLNPLLLSAISVSAAVQLIMELVATCTCAALTSTEKDCSC